MKRWSDLEYVFWGIFLRDEIGVHEREESVWISDFACFPLWNWADVATVCKGGEGLGNGKSKYLDRM